MPLPTLAKAFLNDGGNPNRAFPTFPGGRLEFRGNEATIRDERDMVHALTMPNIVIDFSPERVEWLPEWALKAWPKTVAAKLNAPAGWEIHQDDGDILVYRTKPEVTEEEFVAEVKSTWKPKIRKISSVEDSPVSD